MAVAVSEENGCGYCVAAHSAAEEALKAAPMLVDALRARQPLPDAKLEALRAFALAVVRERGRVSEEAVQGFVGADYDRGHQLEVLLTLKTLSNYTNHIAVTPLDAAFARRLGGGGRR